MEQNPMEKNYKSFGMEVSHADERETKISENEIKGLSPDKISDKVSEICFKKTQDHFKGSSDPENKFTLKDKIYFINNLDINLGGAKEYELNLEIKGILKDLQDKYKGVLAEKIKELGLKDDQLYAIHDWSQELFVYSKDKKEEEIDENTTCESFYDSKIVTEDKPRF